MNDKIRPNHLARKAVLYVRQSSAYQVSHNLESQRLQYAMRDRLLGLGWTEIEVVDEDLGRSAAGMVTRSGFERMVVAFVERDASDLTTVPKVQRLLTGRADYALALHSSLPSAWQNCPPPHPHC